MLQQAFRMGEHNVVIAGGMERMSKAPTTPHGSTKRQEMGYSKLVDSMIHDGLWDVYNNMHMGNTGEVVARECSIDAGKLMFLSSKSLKGAAKDWDEGWFDWETFALEIPQNVEGFTPFWNERKEFV
jgi:acetyl-CoA C-acetyltransferase